MAVQSPKSTTADCIAANITRLLGNTSTTVTCCRSFATCPAPDGARVCNCQPPHGLAWQGHPEALDVPSVFSAQHYMPSCFGIGNTCNHRHHHIAPIPDKIPLCVVPLASVNAASGRTIGACFVTLATQAQTHAAGPQQVLTLSLQVHTALPPVHTQSPQVLTCSTRVDSRPPQVRSLP